MISILIPVFNRNVIQLATALQLQVSAATTAAEIIIMDDGSTDQLLKDTNRNQLEHLTHVRYIELPVNSGRNRIRHKLAATASYETLIFLDADSRLPDDNWLQRYQAAAGKGDIIMGGRLYDSAHPAFRTLHFHYGQLREQRTASHRNRHPYQSFLACNFLASKAQLSSLITDERLQGYCHEDTFMGLQFEKLGFGITHISNPVYHEGIDDDGLFMQKQEEALQNLHYLYTAYRGNYNFPGNIRLIRVYQQVKRFAGDAFLDALANRKALFKRKALQSQRLFWLDCWKLAAFIGVRREA